MNTLRLFRLVKYSAIALVILKAILAFPRIGDAFMLGDNDDMMRLMSIRAWLAGQDWFDMTQYRVLPPEGVSMHWSRILDFFIAGLVVPASWVMPMAQAEHFALVAWPSLLLIALIVLVANGTLRVLGTLAAYVAVICLFVWLPTGTRPFDPGHIDHHNVQILMMSVVAFAMIWPGAPLRRGICAGLAAAVSLMVGLEMLALVVVAGGIMAVRAAFGVAGADRLLAGFCTTLVVACALLFAGQTGPDAWLTPRCDALAPPILAVTLIAAIACLVPMAARRWLPNPALRLSATIALVLAGVAVCWPLLHPCLAGPYGNLPPEVRAMMTTWISEAQPGLVFAGRRPLVYNSIVTPVAGAILLSALFWLTGRARSPTEAAERDAALQMILLASVGLAGSFVQMRMISLAACAVPFLTGYVFLCLSRLWQTRRGPVTALIAVVCTLATLLPPQMAGPVAWITALTSGTGPGNAPQAGTLDDTCRSIAALKALDALPKARMLTTLNMGAPLILVTHHDALAAPYHRSADAFWNGVFPFQTAAALQTALTRSRPEYVVLCKKTAYGDDFPIAAALLRGDMVDGLQPVPFVSDDLAVFRVAVPGS
jgi:hypothetical protein